MRKHSQLDALMPRIRQSLLYVLLRDSNRKWYLSDLAREVAVTPSSLQRELRTLTEADIINRLDDGNRVYYQANKNLPYLFELKSILNKTIGIFASIRQALEQLPGDIEVAFVYGSFATGLERH